MRGKDGNTSNKTGFRWLGFIPQLFFFILLPLTILVLVVTISSISLHQRAMRDMAGEQDLRTVRATARVIDQEIQHRTLRLQYLARRLEDGVSPQVILETSGDLEEAFDAGLAFIKDDGSVIAATQPAPWQAIVEMQFEPLKTQLEQTGDGRPVYSPAFIDPDSGEWLVVIAVSEGPERIVAGAFTPRSVAAHTLPGVTGHESLVTLLDRGGQVLYQSGSMHPEGGGEHPGFAEALRGESGITYISIDGSEHVVAFSPVDPLDWALVIEQPWEAMASPMLRSTQMAPLVLVPVLLMMLVGLWFGLRQIVQPLQALETQANAMAWKNFTAIQQPVGGIAEIQRLQATLMEMARRVQAAQENLRSYIGAITTGQEDERRRLAREIHDDTLQSIVALNQRVQLAHLDLGEHPAGASLAEIQGLTEQTIANLRRLVRALRPAYLEELGLPASLEILARETAQAAGLPVQFRCTGSERRLAPEVELTLYRMAQESLSNAVHHAQASQIEVQVEYGPEEVRITVRDDGRGFIVPENPGEFAPAGHFGLLGLYERAELCGAGLELRSHPGQGTTVEIFYSTEA